jgi:hypothetical protein
MSESRGAAKRARSHKFGVSALVNPEGGHQ